MATLTTTEREVLDATAEDVETLEQIYQRVHRPPSSAPLADVADAVRSLVEKGLLAARSEHGGRPWDDVRDASFVWKAWFAITPQGQASRATSAQENPEPPEQPRSLFGAWKDYNIDLKLEDLEEVRREMWEGFPRELPE